MRNLADRPHPHSTRVLVRLRFSRGPTPEARRPRWIATCETLCSFALLAATLVACKWTEFDNLREEAWVVATEKPDNGSSNWGVAIQRGQLSSPTGGRIAVVGTAESIYNEVEYTATGGAKIAGNEQKLNSQFGVGNLDPQPILLANPTSDEVALVTKFGAQEVVVLAGTSGALTAFQLFGAVAADAATYMVAPGIDGGVTAQPAQPIVASGNILFGTFFTPPETPFQQVKCELVLAGAPISITALGAVRLNPNATSDEVVVWASSGKLYRISGQVFNGARSSGGACLNGTADLTNAPQLAVPFAPTVGSQVLVFGNRFAILQGHNADLGFLGLVDLMTMQLIGAPRTDNGLKTASLHEVNGQVAVIAGYPLATFEGVNCGEARVFEIDTGVGIAAAPTEVLRDASPEDGQSYGRALTSFEFNGQRIIAIAGDNEVFTYFRTSTLYGDARLGR